MSFEMSKGQFDTLSEGMGCRLMGGAMKYLTTTEAAEILGVNQSRVRQLIAEGILPAEKMGRDWVIKFDDIKKGQDRPGKRMGI